MAEENLESGAVGIAATINGQDVEQGVRQFVTKLNELETATNNTVANLNSAFGSVNETIEEMAKKLGEAAINASDIKVEIKAKVKESSDLKSSESTTVLEEKEKKIKELNDELSNLRKTWIETDEKATEKNKELADSVEKLEKAQKRLEELKAANNGGVTTIERYEEKVKKLEEAVNNGKSVIQSLYDKMYDLEDKMAKVKGEINGISTGSTNSNTSSSLTFFDKIFDKLYEFKAKVNSTLSEASQPVAKWAENLKNKISETFSSISSAVESKVGFSRLGEEFNKLGNTLSSYKDKVVDVATGHGKMQAGLSQVANGLNMMPIPLGNAAKGIKTVTSGLWAMVTTPVGAVLAAIVLALKAFHTWLNKSADGQKVLAKMTAYFGSLMSSITDIVIIFGEYLYHTFADAGAPMNEFANNFKQMFVSAFKAISNLVVGLGTAFKGIFTLDFDTFTKGVSTYMAGLKGAGETIVNTFKTAVTGVKGVFNTVSDMANNTNLSTKLADAFNSMGAKAQQAMELAEKQTEATIALSEAKEFEARQDEEIAELREKAYALSGKEKQEVLATLKAKQQEKFDKRIAAEQKLLEVQKAKNLAHASTLEDMERERSLTTQLMRTQAQQAAATRFTTRMMMANEKAMKNAGNREANQENALSRAEYALSEAERKAAMTAERRMQDELNSIEEARIKSIADSAQREREQREYDNKLELQQIERETEDKVDAIIAEQEKLFNARENAKKAKNKGYIITTFNRNDMSHYSDSSALDQIATIQGDAALKAQYSNQAYYNAIQESMTQKYRTESQKRIDIEKSYDDDIKEITQLRAQREVELLSAMSDEEKDIIQSQIDSLDIALAQLNKNKGIDLSKFDFEQLKLNPDYIRAFEDLGNTSTETLEYLIEMFEKAKASAAENLQPEQLAAYTQAIEKMQETILARDPFKNLTNSANKAHSAQIKLAKAKEQYNLAKGTEKEKNALVELNKAMDENEKAQNQYKKAMTSACSVVDKLASEISNLGSAIGGAEGEILGCIAQTMNFATSTIQGIQTLATISSQSISATLKAVESASVILAIVSAAVQLMQAISKLYKDEHAQYEAYAEKVRNVNQLTESMNSYKMAVLAAQQAESGWLNNSGLGKLRDQFELSGQAMESYFSKLTEAQAIYQNESGGGWLTNTIKAVTEFGNKITNVFTEVLGINGLIGKVGDIFLTGFAGLGTSIANKLINGKQYKEGTVAAMNNLRIETRAKSKGFLGSGIGGKSQKTEDLISWVKENFNGAELFDGDGWINVELANQVLADYGEKLVGETKQTLETLVKLKEDYDEFREQLKDYVSNLYSPLLDNMTDSLWDWLKEGTNVMDSFKKYASDTFADIAKDMVKQMLYTKIFKGLEEQLTDVYTMYSAKAIDETALADLIGGVFDNWMDSAEKQLPAMQSALEHINEVLKERGINILGSDEVKASESDFADVVSAFNNAMSDMQMTAKDAANNISESFYQAMVNQRINDKYKSQIEEWYSQFDSANKNGAVTQDLIARLKSQYNAIVKEALQERNELAELTGHKETYSQQASQGAFQSMSQESADELNGRFTALQVITGSIQKSTDEIRNNMIANSENIKLIVDTQQQSVTFLSKIAQNTNELYQMNQRLANIENYTSRL